MVQINWYWRKTDAEKWYKKVKKKFSILEIRIGENFWMQKRNEKTDEKNYRYKKPGVGENFSYVKIV